MGDIGTHWMDTIDFILGSRINSLFADLGIWHKTRKRPLFKRRRLNKTKESIKFAPYRVETEDFASVLFRFNGGVRGNLAVSQVAAGRKNRIRIEIYGSQKSAWWCSEDPETLHFGTLAAEPDQMRSQYAGTSVFGSEVAPYINYPGGQVEGFPDTFKMLFRAIYEAIRVGNHGEQALFATAEDGHHEVAVCEAILQSNSTKSWVAI